MSAVEHHGTEPAAHVLVMKTNTSTLSGGSLC